VATRPAPRAERLAEVGGYTLDAEDMPLTRETQTDGRA